MVKTSPKYHWVLELQLMSNVTSQRRRKQGTTGLAEFLLAILEKSQYFPGIFRSMFSIEKTVLFLKTENCGDGLFEPIHHPEKYWTFSQAKCCKKDDEIISIFPRSYTMV